MLDLLTAPRQGGEPSEIRLGAASSLPPVLLLYPALRRNLAPPVQNLAMRRASTLSSDLLTKR